MFKVTERVQASTIWEGEIDQKDFGAVSGLVRGYNFEVIREGKNEGKPFWHSCVWIYGDIEVYLNSEITKFYFEDMGMKPTGRVSFRGYGQEYYDPKERETFIKDVVVA